MRYLGGFFFFKKYHVFGEFFRYSGDIVQSLSGNSVLSGGCGDRSGCSLGGSACCMLGVDLRQCHTFQTCWCTNQANTKWRRLVDYSNIHATWECTGWSLLYTAYLAIGHFARADSTEVLRKLIATTGDGGMYRRQRREACTHGTFKLSLRRPIILRKILCIVPTKKR